MTDILLHQDRLTNLDATLVSFAKRLPEVLGGRWGVGRGATTDAEQRALYDQGRTATGPGVDAHHPHGRCVTEASNAAETAHGVRLYGACALDFVAFREDGTPDWTPPRYRALGEYAKRCGFEWGGDFTRRNPFTGLMEPFPDLGHVQIPNWRGIPLQPKKEAGNV